MSGGLSTLYGREPVMVLAVVQTGLVMLMGFGLELSAHQLALVMAFSAALLGVLTRTQVTPVATLPDHVAAAVVNASNAGIAKVSIAESLGGD